MHENFSPMKIVCKLGKKEWNFMSPAQTVPVVPIQGDEQMPFGVSHSQWGRKGLSTPLPDDFSTEPMQKASCWLTHKEHHFSCISLRETILQSVENFHRAYLGSQHNRFLWLLLVRMVTGLVTNSVVLEVSNLLTSTFPLSFRHALSWWSCKHKVKELWGKGSCTKWPL